MVWKQEWRTELRTHKNLILISLIFLIIAVFLSYLTGLYVLQTEGMEVPDLLLDHLPVLDLGWMFVYGIVAVVTVFFAYPLFFSVKDLHKAISQFSLLILVRGVFTCLTHLSTPLEMAPIHYPWVLSYLDFQDDLFFSGHTAIPFLGFLLFKDSKMGWFFLVSTIAMASTVLLMHAHYSIDVFSAFFITYSTFKIGQKIFRKLNHY